MTIDSAEEAREAVLKFLKEHPNIKPAIYQVEGCIDEVGSVRIDGMVFYRVGLKLANSYFTVSQDGEVELRLQ